MVQMIPSAGLHLGQLVHTAGSLEHYQGRLQLTVKFLSVEKDSNAEPAFWLECALLQQTSYSALPQVAPESADHKRHCTSAPSEQQSSAMGGARCTESGGHVASEAERALEASITAFAVRRDTFRYAELLDDPAVGAAARALLRARGAWRCGARGCTGRVPGPRGL